MIQIADDIALKLLNGSSDFVRRSFSTFIFMDKCRVGTRAIAAFIADCKFA
jgi:hypothetical protein